MSKGGARTLSVNKVYNVLRRHKLEHIVTELKSGASRASIPSEIKLNRKQVKRIALELTLNGVVTLRRTKANPKRIEFVHARFVKIAKRRHLEKTAETAPEAVVAPAPLAAPTVEVMP